MANMPQVESSYPDHRSSCEHDSCRMDGTLDNHCLLCGIDGYWHKGHRHDRAHPGGEKILIILHCLDCPR